MGTHCVPTGEETQPCPGKHPTLMEPQFCPEQRCPPGLSGMMDMFRTCVGRHGGAISPRWQGALETCLVQWKNCFYFWVFFMRFRFNMNFLSLVWLVATPQNSTHSTRMFSLLNKERTSPELRAFRAQ